MCQLYNEKKGVNHFIWMAESGKMLFIDPEYSLIAKKNQDFFRPISHVFAA